MKIITACAITWLALLRISAADAAPFFSGLGTLPGGPFLSTAADVSADGTTVVGWSQTGSGFSNVQGFRWQQSTGMIALGGPQTFAQAVSADGSVIVGHGAFGAESGAFRWTEAGGFEGLTGTGVNASANDVSADGSIVVGSDDGLGCCNFQAFTWTQAGGPVGLGHLPDGFSSGARGVSADGGVVVGSDFTTIDNIEQAFLWTQDNGMAGLGTLPGHFHSRATGVSGDGAVVVGFSSVNDFGPFEAFRWTESTGMVGLGFRSGSVSASGDGSIVVGGGWIWDEANGPQSLADVLVNDYGLGTSLADWSLGSATGISADGRTIVGNGTNPNGDKEGWIAHLGSTVPEPSSVRLLMMAAAGLLAVRNTR